MVRVLGSKLEKPPRDNTLLPGLPKKPSDLSPAASSHWDRLLQEMQDSGILLVPGDRAAVAMTSKLMADLDTAWQQIQQDGRYVTSKTGVMRTHPAVDDHLRLTEKLARALWQLNLTPRSRGNAPAKADEPPMSEGDLAMAKMLDESARKASGKGR